MLGPLASFSGSVPAGTNVIVGVYDGMRFNSRHCSIADLCCQIVRSSKNYREMFVNGNLNAACRMHMTRASKPALFSLFSSDAVLQN
jgi:hypothetical protein